MQEFSTTFRSLYTVFTAAVGDFSSETYLKHHNPTIAVTLMVIYLFIVAVIMLNLLIALLTTSQEKVCLTSQEQPNQNLLKIACAKSM